jgi:hypothetical protein
MTNSKLQSWLDYICTGSVATDFSEVHIDTLASQYKNVSLWIKGTIELLNEAMAYAAANGVAGLLAGSLALRSSEEYIGVNYLTCADLEREFCLTPPSIYHFRKGKSPWQSNNLPFQTVEMVDFPIDPVSWQLLHLEYRERSEPEYRRSLWIVPR